MPELSGVGKLLVVLGVALAVVGGLITLLDKLPGLGIGIRMAREIAG